MERWEKWMRHRHLFILLYWAQDMPSHAVFFLEEFILFYGTHTEKIGLKTRGQKRLSFRSFHPFFFLSILLTSCFSSNFSLRAVQLQWRTSSDRISQERVLLLVSEALKVRGT